MPPFPVLSALPRQKKLLLCSNAPVIECQSSRRPSPNRKEQKKEKEKEKEKEKKKQTRKEAFRSPERIRPLERVKTCCSNAHYKKRKKALCPDRVFPCACPALLVLVLFSYPCSFVMNYYAHAHAVDDWLLRVAAIKFETV